MAGEIQVPYPPNRTVYVLLFSKTGQAYNTVSTLFESYLTANFSLYPISCTQLGTGQALYTGTFPAAIAPGVYGILAKAQQAGSPAEGDPNIGSEDFQWGGSSELALSDLATSGQLGQFGPIRLSRGSMIQNFPFKMVSSLDHVTPFTSGVVSGQIARDAGLFGALQSGAFTETGLGWYRVSLTSGDMLANTIALVFTANGVSGGTSDQRDIGIVLQRTSGQ